MAEERCDYEVVEPRAESLIDSLRSVGYSTKAAVADLIDNSITAGATTVWIDLSWRGEDSFITIADNGRGMSSERLTEAMRAGSSSPLDDRAETDLGRFGLGLKTASFSQCRCLTVASRVAGGETSIRRWDLETVRRFREWRLLTWASSSSVERLAQLDDMDHGTVVLWEQMDRVVGNHAVTDVVAKRHFLELADEVREHLEMTFHRFLEGPRPALHIFMNGREEAHALKPWDPFLAGHPSTILSPVEFLTIPGSGTFEMQGFVLPHKDKLGDELHRRAAGPGGWNAQQGFYVYRSRRLVVAGSWLGLGTGKPWTKEEHYKLARLRLDLPNSMDAEWNVDIKKSTARPPTAARERLKDLADRVRREAREVFAHRGCNPSRRQRREPYSRIWYPKTVAGEQCYRLDRAHPLLRQVQAKVPRDTEDFELLMRLIEETIPVQQIWLDSAEKSELVARPFAAAKRGELERLASTMLEALIAIDGLSRDKALDRLRTSDPFVYYPEALASLEMDSHFAE